MKRKYHAVWGLLTILISLLVVAVRFFGTLSNKSERRPAVPFKPLITVPVPDPKTIRQMGQLETVMDQLGRPQSSITAPVDLTLFGYQPVTKRKIIEAGRGILLPPEMYYSLTLAFSAGTKRFCVIGGQFYEEGASLPDGGKIIAIEPNRVLISKQRFTNWIPVSKTDGDGDTTGNRSGENL
jgi:hypothetical protein